MWNPAWKHSFYLVLLVAAECLAPTTQHLVHQLLLGTAARYAVHIVLNAVAKWDTFAAPRRLHHKNPPLTQLARERDYDNAFLFSILAFLVVKACTPFLSNPQPLTGRSLLYCFLGHMLITEPIYYCFHRWMHWPNIYRLTHFHHHTSTTPEPNSGSSHPVAENLAYMVNFSFAFLVPAFFTCYSDALIAPYFVLFDILNIVGHSNVEWMPRWWYDTPCRYLLYTTTHHSLHHSKFKCNYCLFCPFWDVVGGTLHPKTVPTFHRTHAQGVPALDVVFLCHGFGYDSVFHNTWVNPYGATQAYTPTLWNRLCMPLVWLAQPALRRWGSTYCAQRYTFGSVRCATWVLPRLAYDYLDPANYPAINAALVHACWQAAAAGATHVGLGAFNKHHALNDGGGALVKHLPKTLRLVHGNTLTTAMVWDVLQNTLPPASTVGLLGPTSKIGRVLVQKLCSAGHSVRAVTMSDQRYATLRAQVSVATEGRLNKQGLTQVKDLRVLADCEWWVIGKALRPSVANMLNTKATLFDFAAPRVPEGVSSRFAAYHNSGKALYSPTLTDLTFNHDVPGSIPSCLAAAIIHAWKQTKSCEVGSVDPTALGWWGRAAQDCGFRGGGGVSSTDESGTDR